MENLALFAAFMVGTPGPANTIVMAAGTRNSFASCLPFILGLLVGKAALNLGMGLGFGALLQGDALAITIMTYASAAFMIYLAAKNWKPPNNAKNGQPSMTFVHGIIVHPLNPKAWAMTGLAWSRFAPQIGEFPVQLVAVVGTFAVMQIVFHSLWCLAGVLLNKSVPNSTGLNRVMIVLTVLVVLLVLISTISI